GERVENLVLGIRRDRLACRKVAVPVGKLAMLHDIPKDLLGRVVVARQVAHVELVDAEENIRERDRGDQKEECEREQIGAAAGRRKRRVIHGARLKSSRNAANFRCAILPRPCRCTTRKSWPCSLHTTPKKHCGPRSTTFPRTGSTKSFSSTTSRAIKPWSSPARCRCASSSTRRIAATAATRRP